MPVTPAAPTPAPPTGAYTRPVVQSIANNFGTVASVVPNFLNIVDFAHRVVGPKPLQFLSEQLMKLPGHIMPLWTPHMPRVCHCAWPCLAMTNAPPGR